MMSCRALTVIALVSFFYVIASPASAQCTNALKSEKWAVSESGIGSFMLAVKSDGPFKGELTRISGIQELSVSVFSGSSTDNIKFSDLIVDDDSFYRVTVNFTSEDTFLCKQRVLDVEFINSK
ncbi:MAG: hypothetical protein RIB47_08720 [Cyclobacteriaceae bacterium]